MWTTLLLACGAPATSLPTPGTPTADTAPIVTDPPGPCEHPGDWTYEDQHYVICVTSCEDWTIECQGGDCWLYDGDTTAASCPPDGGDGMHWCWDAVACFFP